MAGKTQGLGLACQKLAVVALPLVELVGTSPHVPMPTGAPEQSLVKSHYGPHY